MDIVIVGGGYAGMACAARLMRRLRRQNTPARVQLVCPEPVLVERIRLHQRAAGQPLPLRRTDLLLERLGVQWVNGTVRSIDLQAQTLRTESETLRWDRLVLATGSHAGVPPHCTSPDAVFNLNATRASALSDRLHQVAPGARVVVVGGGLTGIEAASEIAERYPHLSVSLVTGGELAIDFSLGARTYIRQTLTALGVRVHEQTKIEQVHANLLTTPTGGLGFDVCIWATGLRVDALARKAGLGVNPMGQVRVDPQLRSVSHPAVYAAGDIVAPVLPPGQPLPLGCKAALPAGAHVGDNLANELAGRPPQAFDFALTLLSVSLGRRAGLVQLPDANGSPTGRILTGRPGAWIKELICRSTWWSLVLEARGWPAILWQRTGRAPQTLKTTDAKKHL